VPPVVGPIEALNQATKFELRSVDGMTDELFAAIKELDFDSWEDFSETTAHLKIEPALLPALQAKTADWHNKSMSIAPLIRKGRVQSCREVGRRSKVAAVGRSKSSKPNTHTRTSSSANDDDDASGSGNGDKDDKCKRSKSRRLPADKDINTSSRSKRTSTAKSVSFKLDQGSNDKGEGFEPISAKEETVISVELTRIQKEIYRCICLPLLP
jgi:hypothetical protein